VNVNLSLGEGCLEKQRSIDRLKQKIQSLREKMHRLERKAEQGPFGSSTPPAKFAMKANTAEEQRGKPGGAKRSGTATPNASKRYPWGGGLSALRRTATTPATGRPARSNTAARI